MEYIDTILCTAATLEVQKEMEEDMKKVDPSFEKAQAVIDENEKKKKEEENG